MQLFDYRRVGCGELSLGDGVLTGLADAVGTPTITQETPGSPTPPIRNRLVSGPEIKRS